MAVVSNKANEIPDRREPATKLTAVASPSARPTPKIAAVKIPDLAEAHTTLKFVCVGVAPNASDP